MYENLTNVGIILLVVAVILGAVWYYFYVYKKKDAKSSFRSRERAQFRRHDDSVTSVPAGKYKYDPSGLLSPHKLAEKTLDSKMTSAEREMLEVSDPSTMDYNGHITDLVSTDRMKENQRKWRDQALPKSGGTGLRHGGQKDDMDEAVIASLHTVGFSAPDSRVPVSGAAIQFTEIDSNIVEKESRRMKSRKFGM